MVLEEQTAMDGRLWAMLIFGAVMIVSSAVLGEAVVHVLKRCIGPKTTSTQEQRFEDEKMLEKGLIEGPTGSQIDATSSDNQSTVREELTEVMLHTNSAKSPMDLSVVIGRAV